MGRRRGRALAALADRSARPDRDRLRTSLSSVLKPVAFDARRRQTVLELADAVAHADRDGKALSLHATGPADLLERLAQALGQAQASSVVEPDDDVVDVRIDCDQTIVESRLRSWRTALEEALA